MNRNRKIGLISAGGVVSIAVLVVAVWIGFGNRAVRRALSLQAQLTSKDNLSNSQRTQLVDQLIREVDQMDRDQLRQLWQKTRDRQRDVTQASVRDFHNLPPAEQTALLDRDIDRMRQWREISFAMRPDSLFRFRGDPRGGGPPRGERSARAPRPRPDQGARGGQRTGPQPGAAQRNRGDNGSNNPRDRRARDGGRSRDRDRREMTDEQREELAAYYEALRKRAEERGVSIRGRGNRRP